MTKEIISRDFACPVCGCHMEITEDGKSVKCNGENTKGKRHSFDFSADGYLSFGANGGDSKEAVKARSAFLGKDYYLPAAEAVADAVKKHAPRCELLIDAGCGEGYYTARLAEFSQATIGFDLSKFACANGAKQAKRAEKDSLLYATASVFELPIQSGSADVVTNIFAPCAEEEYCRVLKEGGLLFVVGAGKDHLMGLKKAIYENIHENGSRADLPKNMKHLETVLSSHKITVESKEDIAALFSMTPYYWRTSERDKEKLTFLDRLETEIEFEINIYQKQRNRP